MRKLEDHWFGFASANIPYHHDPKASGTWLGISRSTKPNVQHNDQTQEVPLTDSTKDVLVDKFKVTRHKKPYPAFTGKHFVLTPANDVAARVALSTYATEIEKKFPKKALAIRRWLEDITNAENDARLAGQAEAVSKLRASKKL